MDRWRGLARLARRVVAVLVLSLCAAGILVATPDPACACKCAPMLAEQAFDRADAVFVGRVVAREPRRPFPWVFSSSIDPAVWTFEVTRVYKGEVRRRQEVVSHAQSSACGLDLQDSGPFVVFAYQDGADPTPGDGQLTTHRCSGTGPIRAEVRRTLARVPASNPTPTPASERGWRWIGAAAGIGVLATGAWWLWHRRRRRTG
jgi:hypothetical protein